MSTKNLQALIEWVSRQDADTHAFDGAFIGPPSLEACREDLAAIREAAKTLDRLHVGDYTYKVRERAHVLKETPDGESTWDHPDVKAWSDASVLLATIAKEG